MKARYARDIRLGIVLAKRYQLIDFDLDDWDEGRAAYEIQLYTFNEKTPKYVRLAYYKYNKRHERLYRRPFHYLFDGFTRFPIGTVYL